MELKLFASPTCPTCSMAKAIASETAQKLGIAFREINIATEEGLNEGLACGVKNIPSIAIDKEVIVRGRLISKEKLEEEVKKKIEEWKERATTS